MGEAGAHARYAEQDVHAWNVQLSASVHLDADRRHAVLFPSPSGNTVAQHCNALGRWVH